MPQPPLTTAEVADLFGVTPQAVARWADAGKIPHFRTPGGQLRFRSEELEPLLTSTAAPAVAS
jgi:excisionase family DNA binding protein